MYKAIVTFADLTDGGRVYREGDAFPRNGLEVSEERLTELSTAANRQGKPLIGNVDEKPKRTRRRVNRDAGEGA